VIEQAVFDAVPFLVDPAASHGIRCLSISTRVDVLASGQDHGLCPTQFRHQCRFLHSVRLNKTKRPLQMRVSVRQPVQPMTVVLTGIKLGKNQGDAVCSRSTFLVR
jgi:hypothetical protein